LCEVVTGRMEVNVGSGALGSWVRARAAARRRRRIREKATESETRRRTPRVTPIATAKVRTLCLCDEESSRGRRRREGMMDEVRNVEGVL
jgi:hypothetical protein